MLPSVSVSTKRNNTRAYHPFRLTAFGWRAVSAWESPLECSEFKEN